jgi:hypothetical protein
MVGNLTIDNGTSTTLRVKCDNGGNAAVIVNGDSQGTGYVEVGQSNTYGGGISYNGDGSPALVSGESSDHITFYRLENGTRTEVFHYPYNSSIVNFNSTPTVSGSTVWHAGNDGSGSGLDADTLDGINSGSFLRSDAADNWNVGRGDVYIENNSNDNADGAGITLRTSSNPSSTGGAIFAVRSSGQAARFWVGQDVTSTGYNPLYVGTSDSNNALSTPYILLPTSGNITRGGNTVWDSGNDGSGSGLDADTLDGINSGSFLRSDANDSATGTLTVRDIKLSAGYHLQRSNHHSGHLEGSYNNVGANSYKTNPIYSIGSSYNPNDATLNNFYGIGYSHTNASFINFTGASGWGMYVAADGDARIYLSASNGVISSTGQHYVGSNVVWNAGNDGSGSGLDADTVDGIQGGSFLRSDANDTFTGTVLTINAGSSSNYFEVKNGSDTDNWIRFYCESNTGQIGDTFAGATDKQYIYFSNPNGSNDPGYIMHETRASESNEGILHLVPTDDNAYGDYVSIHGTNDADCLKLHTDGTIETASGYQLKLKSGNGNVYVNDNLDVNGNVNSSSDIKLKTNIKTLTNSLNKVLQMRGVEYDRIDMDNKHQIGVIAQEVEEIIPELVSESDGIKNVTYGNITALLIEAIKEQQDQINTLKQEIENLKK